MRVEGDESARSSWDKLVVALVTSDFMNNGGDADTTDLLSKCNNQIQISTLVLSGAHDANAYRSANSILRIS